MTRVTVNGTEVVLDSDGDAPLLTVLRGELGLVGSRFGCGEGLCGACFVRLGDAVVPSCQTPLWQAEGQAVTTVEGLSSDGTPHPVQQAILDRQAAQCGFCVAGIVVRAATLLEEDPAPDVERVAEALDRNLCRCGSQQRIIDAVVGAGARAVSDLPAHVVANPRLGTWLTVRDGLVEIRVGKVELGQGIVTALAQIAADALALPVDAIRMRPADTSLGPDQGLTSGSKSVEHSGPALRHVGGVVRALTSGPLDPPAAYVDRIGTLDPNTDLTRIATGGARRAPGGRQERGAARPARQGARPAALPRRPASRGHAARPRAATAVARRSAGRPGRGLEGDGRRAGA